MEKRFLEDCLARGMSLEAIGREVGRHPSTVSYWLKKYGLVAVGKSQHAPKGEIDQVRLVDLVGQGVSIRGIANELGAGYSTIRYWVGQLGLETDRMVRRSESRAAQIAGDQRPRLKCARHGHTTSSSDPRADTDASGVTQLPYRSAVGRSSDS